MSICAPLVPGACRGQKALPLKMVVNHVGAGNRTPSMPLCLPSPCLYFKMQTRQHLSSVSDLTKRSPSYRGKLGKCTRRPKLPQTHISSFSPVPAILCFALPGLCELPLPSYAL